MAKKDPYILHSRGLQLDCRAPIPGGAHVMGILNVTPDSFSDGGLYLEPARACEHAIQMVSDGARIIDVGGASSRPKGAAYGEGAALISAREELDRILPVIKLLSKELPSTWISVDTFRSEVAKSALSEGAHMINDITALRFDSKIAEVAASADAPMVLMHSVGLPGEMPHTRRPHTMRSHNGASESIVSNVVQELAVAAKQANDAGCCQILLDPGFGFGKTHEENLGLIEETNTLVALGLPVLIGVSRKTTIGWLDGRDGTILPSLERLPGSLAVTAVAVLRGASIVRTHDVAETCRFLTAFKSTISINQE